MLARRLLLAAIFAAIFGIFGIAACGTDAPPGTTPDAAVFADAAVVADAEPPAPDAEPIVLDADVPDAIAQLDAAAPMDAAAPDAIVYDDWDPAPSLPARLTNNALTSSVGLSGCTAYSATGIGPTRTFDAITPAIYTWHPNDATWAHLADLPGHGRVGASAVVAYGKLHIIGGFEVDALGFEQPYGGIDVFDLASGQWEEPIHRSLIAIDSAVAVFHDYIVVVGGWRSCCSGVETIAPDNLRRTSGAPLPVELDRRSGHAIAVAGDHLYVLGGMTEAFEVKHDFWRARIRELELDPGFNFAYVDQWTELDPYPGPARFRAAAGVVGDQLVIHGGSSTPYNYDGLSFEDGSPAEPIGTTLVYDTVLETWQELENTPPTMDHSEMINCGDRLLVAGGMTAGPSVSDAAWQLTFPIAR